MHLVDKSQPLPGSRSVSEFYKRALYTKQVGQFHGLLRRLMRRDTTVLLCLFPCTVFDIININSVLPLTLTFGKLNSVHVVRSKMFSKFIFQIVQSSKTFLNFRLKYVRIMGVTSITF